MPPPPALLDAYPAVLERAGVADRCEILAESFFNEVPSGADACTLKSIIHDYEDERAVAILRICRHAMAPDATLLLSERIVGPPNEDRLLHKLYVALEAMGVDAARTLVRVGLDSIPSPRREVLLDVLGIDADISAAKIASARQLPTVGPTRTRGARRPRPAHLAQGGRRRRGSTLRFARSP